MRASTRLSTLTAAGIALATLGGVGCGAATVEERSQRPILSRPLTVERGAGGPPVLYTVDKDFYGHSGHGRVRLRAAPVAPLAGWLSPAAVPSPDGRFLAYNVWIELRREAPELSWQDQGIERGDPLATPALRVYDAVTGEDSLLEAGAYSIAWRADGELAYVRGAERDFRASKRYVGDVVVRPALGEPAVAWTADPRVYVVGAWAGSRLLVYRLSEGEHVDTIVLDGPGRMRVLAAGATVVAISPDGAHVLLEEGAESGAPRVRIVRVADGMELARAETTGLGPVSYAGDWVGDLVLARARPGLVVFRAEEGAIAVEQVLGLDPREFPQGAIEPRFLDGSGRRIVAAASASVGAVFLECDRIAGRCIETTPAPAAEGSGRWPAWRRLAHNPSRPAAGVR